jgi:hypothetical protein
MCRVLAILLGFVLIGCNTQTKHAAMAECQMKATQVYPHQSGDEARGEAGDYTYLCMVAKGYVSLNDPDRCPIGRGWVGEIDERCYRMAWPWE